MSWRRAALFVAMNVIISATVTLLILSAWDARRPAAPSPVSVAQATPVLAAPASTPLEKPTVALTPTARGPFTYAIQSGDTLGDLSLRFDVSLEGLLAANDLSEDAILSVGQEIIIPAGGSTEIAPPATTAAKTPATSGPALVVIREIEEPGSLNGETVILTNLGEVINLTGWTLSDGRTNRYTFPDVTLFPDAEINVHTRTGTDTPSDLYWGASDAIWGATGTVAYLRDASGKLVATYRVP
ncbi:MAG TPA: lamin tail domain-containing protein [Anaerolineae bacterium]|nr:lamin tail domain-containing protein [Anaerolineae bacterium]